MFTSKLSNKQLSFAYKKKKKEIILLSCEDSVKIVAMYSLAEESGKKI